MAWQGMVKTVSAPQEGSVTNRVDWFRSLRDSPGPSPMGAAMHGWSSLHVYLNLGFAFRCGESLEFVRSKVWVNFHAPQREGGSLDRDGKPTRQ